MESSSFRSTETNLEPIAMCPTIMASAAATSTVILLAMVSVLALATCYFSSNRRRRGTSTNAVVFDFAFEFFFFFSTGCLLQCLLPSMWICYPDKRKRCTNFCFLGAYM